MLNPDAVAGLRLQIQQAPDLCEFQGHLIKRVALSLADGDGVDTITVSEASRGLLRPPSRVFGVPTDPSCLNGIRTGEQHIRKVIFSTVKLAKVIGNNFVIGHHGQAFGPSAAATQVDFDHIIAQNRENHQGFAAELTAGGVHAYYAGSREPTHHNVKAIFLHNLEPANYGSFLFRQLPQMLFLRDLGVDFDAYIVPDRTSWLREALQLVGLPNRPIFTVREIAGDTFATIGLFNEFDAEGFFSEIITAKTTSLARTVWPATIGSGQKRLYLSRRLGTVYRPDYRPLTNEAAVEELFRAQGYTIIYPETLGLADQVGLFRKAHHVAGPSGSGMLNTMFSDSETKVLDMESFHFTVRQHAKIYSSTGKEYSFLFGIINTMAGLPLHIAPWSVPESLLLDAMSWLET